MANKQTAGLQLIDLKGIELANGPVKIKGVYQQVIANKFIKTITNLVYDGYAYDDFPITLTTTDGLTYTGKYIDTVSSEMLQWLSITINNKSEVTVTKELFQGGGGGYEEIPAEEITSIDDLYNVDLIVFTSTRKISVTVGFNKTVEYDLERISNIVKDENGLVTDIETTNVGKVSSSGKGFSFVKTTPNFLAFDIGTKAVFKCDMKYPNNIYNKKWETSDVGLILGVGGATARYKLSSSNSKSFSLFPTGFAIPQYIGNTMGPTSFQGSIQPRKEELKFYRDKALSKLLQSI